MGLLYACCLCKINITAIHVNHHIHEKSNDWAKMVQDFCHKISVPIIVKSVNLPKNNEATARDMRYQALLSCLQNGDTLLMAHHAQDQAETVLMNLCRGAGVDGLSGMAEISEQVRFGKRFWLVRPFLHLLPSQIHDFCRQHQIPYVNDPSNFLPEANARAYLRAHVLPLLNARFVNATQNIAKSANLLQNLPKISADYHDFGWYQTLDIANIKQDIAFVIRNFAKSCGISIRQTQTQALAALAMRDNANHQTKIICQQHAFFRYQH